MPRVSVVIPTHSRPQLLERAVASAREAGTDVEVVVVDDASTDSTAEVCKRLGEIKYIRVERNQGVAGARNIGILATSAEYIAFLDDDDIRLRGTLDAQLDVLADNPDVGLVYAPVYLADQDGEQTGQVEPKDCPKGDIFWRLMSRSFIYPSATVIRRECLFSVGLFDPHLAGIDEWDLWVRIAELYSVGVTTEPVAIYRVPDSVSDQLTTAMAEDLFWRYWKRQSELLRLPRAASAPEARRKDARRRMQDLISDKLILEADRALLRRNTGEARLKLLTALRFHPGRAARPWTGWLLLSSLLGRSQIETVSDPKANKRTKNYD